jgi:hypothetical protein
MSDDMDTLFDHRLRSALHGSSLPPAPATLHDFLDDLPRTAAAPRRSVPRWATIGALAAGLGVVAVVGWGAIFGQGGFGPGGEPTPTPIVSPSASPSPTPESSSDTYPAYVAGELLDRRADGTIGGEQVILIGFYSDLRRSPVPCPSLSAATLELGCFDRRQGVTGADAAVGAFVDGQFEPTQAPVVHPYWPESLAADPEAAALLGLTAAGPVAPVAVTLIGHFDDPLAADCPADASPPCADRFVVDDVLLFTDPTPTPTPATAATPFPIDSPPPPPTWMDGCTSDRFQDGPLPGDPIDPPYAQAGWIPKSDIPFEFFAAEMLPEFVYYAVVEGDFPLSIWIDDPQAPGERFRWWGTAACIAYPDGIFPTWVPGSTYRRYEDGRRVDGGDPRDPPPTPSAAP